MSRKYLFLFLITMFVVSACPNKDNDPTPLPSFTGSSQQKVFKEFWEIYDRYYPLMYRKGINWQTVYDSYYPKIKSTTTDDELFTMLKEIMNQKIKDGHSSITYDSDEDSYSPEVNLNIQSMVANQLPNLVTFVNNSDQNSYLSYGTVNSNSNVAYLQSKTFEPINDDDSEFENYKKIVDEALSFAKDKDGVIIDLRTNGGGQSSYAFYLAGRFYNGTQKDIVRKRIKDKTGSDLASLGTWLNNSFEGFSDSRADGGKVAGVDPEDFSFKPSGSFQYDKKVAVLISKNTASSGEFCTMALKQNSKVKTIGNTTFGIYAGSDIFTFSTNNLWKTRVSVQDVEVLYDGNFQSFEGLGISPDELSLPTNDDLNQGKDIHLEKGITFVLN